MTRIIAFFICASLTFLSAIAQGDFSLYGSLNVRNYSQKDYKANPQIFSISQSESGLMYFANQRGVLEYDGVNWKTHILPDKAESLDLINGSKFLVTSTSGLGEFVINNFGVIEYEDRNENLPKDVKDLYTVVSFNNQFLVSNFNHLLVLNDNLEVVDEYVNADGTIKDLSVQSDGVYFTGNKNNIIKFDGKSFKIHLKNPFGPDNPVVAVLKLGEERIIVTENGRLYGEYGETVFEVFEDENLTIKSAVTIGDKYLSIGTYVDGIVILDTKFNPVYTINTEKGLKDGTILCQYVDKEQNLWLGTSNGISKVDLMSPIITFQNLFDDATIEDVSILNDKLLMATGGGAYELNMDGSVTKIKGINDDCYGLKKMTIGEKEKVFISALYDVYSYDGEIVKSIAEGGPYNVCKSPLNENHLVVLHYDGLQLLEHKNGEFQEIAYVRNFSDGEPFNFIITESGNIWIGTKPNDGVYMINIDDLGRQELSFVRYYENEGLPIGQTYLFEYEGDVFVGTDFGVFVFNGTKFEPTTKFGLDFSVTGQGVHRISSDPMGNVWMVLFHDENNTYELGYSCKKDNYKWHSEDFTKYSEYIVHSIFHQNENVTWLGGPAGLLTYDKSRVMPHESEFKALIRYVGFGDSILFGGNGDISTGYELNYKSKDKIIFNFSGNSFVAEEKTEYSWMLEGFDDSWSEWSAITQENYSLQEGTYVFKVKARNVDGKVSEVASFAFTILPPWYRTVWAYSLFAILFVVFVFIAIRLSIRRVKRQNIKLEKIVEERTQEVVAQKAEAEKQRDIAEHQKHLVEEKNLEILDSITYAKRLQNAILTPVKFIHEAFDAAFILYLPKDIVAGDFYWTNLAQLNNREGRNMIAAADCTGHGVPGAMVSVVCSNALDRSVKEFGLKKPGEVLDKVTDLVIETFEKSEHEVKDGMDIALCGIEKFEDYTELQYAGANNSLWIISTRAIIENNGEQMNAVLEDAGKYLFEIKATKQPVGKYLERKPFENNRIILHEGDLLYMFTDGYADQFGGDRGKKYKYLPFKRFLLSICKNDLETQLKRLNEEFNNWKGEYEQIDDVCVIGIRV